MNHILKYLQEFYIRDFKVFYFALVLLLLAGCIYLNYWHKAEARISGAESGWIVKSSAYWLLYFVPFALAFFLQYLFFPGITWHKSYWFWIILILAPAFFSLRVNFNLHQPFVNTHWNGDEKIFWTKSLELVFKSVVLFIPVVVIWWIKDTKQQQLYGTGALDNAKPYMLMLLAMVPLIILACTQSDFLHTYPRAKFIGQLQVSPKRWYYFIYECCYGVSFISIEFFFRGFLILALARICGPQCIIPVACFYCAIHFGKPIGEAISSFWGGLLLGIISYNTKSIWGGLIIHLGIAWVMEFCALLQVPV